MVSYDIFSEKASGAVPGVSGKIQGSFRRSEIRVGSTHFSPLVKIQVLDFVQHDFGIADNRRDNVMAA
jgi:hypothetical protein